MNKTIYPDFPDIPYSILMKKYQNISVAFSVFKMTCTFVFLIHTLELCQHSSEQHFFSSRCNVEVICMPSSERRIEIPISHDLIHRIASIGIKSARSAIAIHKYFLP